MAGTIPTTDSHIALLRAQLSALEQMYMHSANCKDARRILDLIHAKRDELAREEMVLSWAA